LILLLLRKLREGFASSVGDCEELSPTCILDLTYRRGTLQQEVEEEGSAVTLDLLAFWRRMTKQLI
jgi:hypothetical protein